MNPSPTLLGEVPYLPQEPAPPRPLESAPPLVLACRPRQRCPTGLAPPLLPVVRASLLPCSWLPELQMCVWPQNRGP
jgi:hypothetical protein